MAPLNSKTILIGLFVIYLAVCTAHPMIISDNNKFLENFVGHDFLSFLGLFLTIAIASLSQLHLSVGKMQDKLGKEGVDDIRDEIKSSAVYLIGCFVASLILVVTKPLIAETDTLQAFFNGAALLSIALYLLILIDITMAIFDIR